MQIKPRWEMVLVALPAVAGFSLSAACKMPRSDEIAFRPPGWVFAVVWPVLYALLGVAWYRTAVAAGAFSFPSAAYAATVLALNLWQVVYSCKGQVKNAVFALLASVLCAAYAIALSKAPERLMLLPLLVWLSFATLLNAQQAVQKAASRGSR